jgi:predicted secreted protein
MCNSVLARQYAGWLGVAFVKLTYGRRRSSIATEIPVNNAAGTSGHRISGFDVDGTSSSAASTFADDGLAAKAAKQFDETKFTLVAVVKGRKNDIKFVFAFI